MNAEHYFVAALLFLLPFTAAMENITA